MTLTCKYLFLILVTPSLWSCTAIAGTDNAAGYYGTRVYELPTCTTKHEGVIPLIAAAVLPQLVGKGVDLASAYAQSQADKYSVSFSGTANDHLYALSSAVTAATDYSVMASRRCIVVERGYFSPKPQSTPAPKQNNGNPLPFIDAPDSADVEAKLDFQFAAKIRSVQDIDPPVFYIEPVQLIVTGFASNGSSPKDFVIAYQFKTESRDDKGVIQDTNLTFLLPALEAIQKNTVLSQEMLSTQVSNMEPLPNPGQLKVGTTAAMPYSVTVSVSETDNGFGKKLWAALADVLTGSKSAIVKAATPSSGNTQ